MSEQRLHLAYVTTGYPYVSHTFIQNEVLALRALDAEIETFAVRREPISECRTAADREAWETTYALRPPNWRHYLKAHLSALRTRPRHYRETIVRALRMGLGSPTDLARHFAYFVQGVVLWDRCREAGISHVHAHFGNVSSDVALLAATLGGDGFSWSYTMHGPTEFYDVRYHRLAEKATDAEFVICVSEFTRSQLMGLVNPERWERFEVVHCGVDVERFAPSTQPDDDVIRITCVGRLVPEKGQALLVEAAATMRRRGLNVRLTLVGDGPQREPLEALVHHNGTRDDVTFLGAVANTEVETVLRQTDIFCLPSFAEGVPVVLMEAMAMELPVVACAVMGIPELIDDGITGRLVRPGSSEDLVQVLSELAANADERRVLGQAARRKVAERFELRACAQRLYGCYARHLGLQA